MHGKLDEIYEWFLANLKTRQNEDATTPTTSGDADEPDDRTLSTPLSDLAQSSRNEAWEVKFALRCEKNTPNLTTNTTLVCPHATFNPAIFEYEISGELPSLVPLFSCLCRKSTEATSNVLNDHTNKLNYTSKLTAVRTELQTNRAYQCCLSVSLCGLSISPATTHGKFTSRRQPPVLPCL
jgi:hypothetical protein